MKNKLKVTISILTVIIIAVITIIIYIYDIKGNKNEKITVSNNSENFVTTSNITSDNEDGVDWSKYQSYDLKLSNDSKTI